MLPKELLKRMGANKPPVIIDVRTGIEFRSGHISGAIHAPAWKILLQLARIPADKNAELVVTCELGPRARIAKGILEFFGYRNVTLLEGQMAYWRKAGHPQDRN